VTAQLQTRAVEYVAQRRSRGYSLRDEEAMLVSFAEGLDARGADRITVADVVAFAQKNRRRSRPLMPDGSGSSGASRSG
jgi:hypothetical protein